MNVKLYNDLGAPVTELDLSRDVLSATPPDVLTWPGRTFVRTEPGAYREARWVLSVADAP